MINSIAFEERTLKSKYSDFPAKYMAACNLHSLIAAHPFSVKEETLTNLESVMRNKQLLRHRHSFFLFQATAQTMATIATKNQTSLSTVALKTLKRLLLICSGASHRAASEALGSLPFSIPASPSSSISQKTTFPEISWQQIAEKAGASPGEKPSLSGRSLIIPLRDGRKILVIKCAREEEDAENLITELKWMNILSQSHFFYPAHFNVPEPLSCKNSFVFSLKNFEKESSAVNKLHPDRLAVAFISGEKYFSYANDPQHSKQFSEFIAVMQQNALLLGYLCSRGIVQTAAIPLFHNRVQRNRREDNGLYDWTRGGRLDRWLASCRFPNIGYSGLRDFEHFIHVKQYGEKLYWHIGTHILSLFLVTASYFRNQEENLLGSRINGQPVDARHLFCHKRVKTALTSMLAGYYEGFVGETFRDELPFDLERLTTRMIDEMGVDNHMEEFLRQVDQQQMTDSEFRDFLITRDFPEKKAAATVRGFADITLLTGPHLGGFNQTISIPELIEATASMAATCVLGRFNREKSNILKS